MPPVFASLEEALAWLDDHIDFESKSPSRRSLPTLQRMRELMAVLGNPERAYPAIHITGTNGKGSTAAMTSALLGARGLSVGTYTSPNLAKTNERISRAGAAIDDPSFLEVLSTLSLIEATLSERPTRFELLTAAAFMWFADVAVDSAVVEVGVGGTWDATNVIDGAVAVLTNVSYDHTDILGPTLEGIARDKAGIVKPGSVAVVGEQDPVLVDAIRSVADEAGAAQVWVRGEEFDCTSNRLAVGGRLLDLRTPGSTYRDVALPLHGEHQGLNAACALAGVEAFFGAPLDPDVVAEGFARVSVPGRLEVVGRRPLCLLDGAHNVAGMRVLSHALGDFAVAGPSVAVIGMLTGRDPSAMIAPLVSAGVQVLVACAPVSPRAQPPGIVADAARAAGVQVVCGGAVRDAVRLGMELAGDEGLVVIAGSLYVVAEARSLLVAEPAAAPPSR
jgi:dihydrofolate synthase/folylpolyglutamate synthase